MINLPGFVITAVLGGSFDSYRVRKAAPVLLVDTACAWSSDTTELRCVLCRVELRFLFQIHVDGVLVLAESPDVPFVVATSIHSRRRRNFLAPLDDGSHALLKTDRWEYLAARLGCCSNYEGANILFRRRLFRTTDIIMATGLSVQTVRLAQPLLLLSDGRLLLLTQPW